MSSANLRLIGYLGIAFAIVLFVGGLFAWTYNPHAEYVQFGFGPPMEIPPFRIYSPPLFTGAVLSFIVGIFSLALKRQKTRARVSLRQAYRDLLLFIIFIGFIISYILSIYYFIMLHEVQFLLLGSLLGILGTLGALARYVFIVESWRAIRDSWHKREREKKGP